MRGCRRRQFRRPGYRLLRYRRKPCSNPRERLRPCRPVAKPRNHVVLVIVKPERKSLRRQRRARPQLGSPFSARRVQDRPSLVRRKPILHLPRRKLMCRIHRHQPGHQRKGGHCPKHQVSRTNVGSKVSRALSKPVPRNHPSRLPLASSYPMIRSARTSHGVNAASKCCNPRHLG